MPGPFAGTWRILTMEVWNQDAFDLLGPARFTFREDGLGSFQFIAVEGGMDCRFSTRDGKPFVEFSWVGQDDRAPAYGRGWATLDGDTITGRIFIHQADDSAFTARREPDGKGSPRRRKGG